MYRSLFTKVVLCLLITASYQSYSATQGDGAEGSSPNESVKLGFNNLNNAQESQGELRQRKDARPNLGHFPGAANPGFNQPYAGPQAQYSGFAAGRAGGAQHFGASGYPYPGTPYGQGNNLRVADAAGTETSTSSSTQNNSANGWYKKIFSVVTTAAVFGLGAYLVKGYFGNNGVVHQPFMGGLSGMPFGGLERQCRPLINDAIKDVLTVHEKTFIDHLGNSFKIDNSGRQYYFDDGDNPIYFSRHPKTDQITFYSYTKKDGKIEMNCEKKPAKFNIGTGYFYDPENPCKYFDDLVREKPHLADVNKPVDPNSRLNARRNAIISDTMLSGGKPDAEQQGRTGGSLLASDDRKADGTDVS